MIEKEAALNMLNDLERCLNDENGKNLTLSGIKQYRKGLLIRPNKTVAELIEQIKGLPEDDPKRIEFSKKIDEITRPIFES